MTDELSLAALKEQGYLVKDVEKPAPGQAGDRASSQKLSERAVVCCPDCR